MQRTFRFYANGELYTLWKVYSAGFGQAHCLPPHGTRAAVALSGYVVHGVEGNRLGLIDHMRRTHNVPLSVKAANLASFFPPWTVTREQWAAMNMPSISGVVIDNLLFSRVGSPLFHRYRIISRTESHAAFWGTYMRRLHAFLEESDSAVMRRLHRQFAQELAARISLSVASPASVPSRSVVGHRSVSRTRRSRRLKGGGGGFFHVAGVGLSPCGGGIYSAGINGSGASSFCWGWETGLVKFIRRGR